jgi:hypothetical protein
MVYWLKRIGGAILLAACGSVFGHGAGGPAREDRWNPQHINGLPPEIRNAIASYARICGVPLAAEHQFALYWQKGSVKLIGLHFERLRCDNRTALCRPSGCLHQVYISTGGGYRLMKSIYVPELDLTEVRIK